MSASAVRSSTPSIRWAVLAIAALLMTTAPAQADNGHGMAVGRPLPMPVVPADPPASSIVFTGDGDVDFDGNPHVVTADTTPSSTVTVTYNGSSTAPTAPGTYALVAVVEDGAETGATAYSTLTISPVTLSFPQEYFHIAYDGAQHGLTPTVVAVGSPTVTVTYNGSTTPPSATGTYIVSASLPAGYAARTAIATLYLGAADASAHLRQSALGWGGVNQGASYAPTGVDLVAVAAKNRNGDSLYLGLTRDGHVRAWGAPGNNAYGQQDPPAELDHVVAIAAGSDRAMAVRADGTLVGWGNGAYGTTDGHGVTDAVQVALTGSNTVVLHADGTLSGWGFSPYPVLSAMPTGNDFVAISANNYHVLGLHADGTVTAWGLDAYGAGALNVPVGLDHVVAISAGLAANLALKDDGTVVRWGWGDYEFGGTPMPDLSNPATAHVVAISIDDSHGAVVKDDGTLVQFGNFFNTPPAMTGRRVAAIATAFNGTVVAATPAPATYDGTGQGLAASEITTVPAGLAVDVTYNGSATLPVHVGSYAVAASVSEAGWTPVPLADTFAIAKRAVTIMARTVYLHVDDPVPSPLPFFVDEYDQPLASGDTIASAFTGALATDADPSTEGEYYTTQGSLAADDYSITFYGSSVYVLPDNTPPDVYNYGPQELVRGEDDATELYAGYDDIDEYGFSQVVTVEWSVLSAPGGAVVGFADLHSASTTASFSIDGEYVLRMSVDDGVAGTQWTDLTVTVVTPVELFFTDGSATYDGAPHALTVTTNPPGYTVAQTFDGTPAAGAINAGTYSVFGTPTTPFTVARGSPGTLTIDKATTTLSFAAATITRLESGLPEVVVATAAAVPPITGTVDVTYNGSSSAPSAVGTYALEATLNDPNYDASPVTASLEITPTALATVRLVPRLIIQSSSNYPTTPVEAVDLVQVIPTTDNFLARSHDGHVFTWGASAPAVPAGLDEVVAIANGYNYDFAVRSDGSVATWGINTDNVQGVPAGTYRDIAVMRGIRSVIGLTTGGDVVMWGASVPFSLPPEITSGGHVVAITAGDFHALALLDDGTVVGMGSNTDGQAAAPAGLTGGVVAIAAGYQFSVALKDDGTVVAWGYNPYGQTDVPVGLEEVVAISAGFTHVAAIKADGTTTGWGYGWFDSPPWNILAGLPGVIAVGGGNGLTAALTTAAEPVTYDGTPHAFSSSNIITDPPGLDVVVTYNGSTTPPTHAGTYTVSVTVAVEAGGYHSAAVTSGLVIGKAVLTASLDDIFIHVDDPLPPITGSASGFVGADDFASVFAPTLSYEVSDSSVAGDYDILTGSPVDYEVYYSSLGGLHVVDQLNYAPELDTAKVQTITLGDPVALDGSYWDFDKEYFGQSVDEMWIKISGPGTAAFSTVTLPCGCSAPGVSFDRDGTYVLRYIVDDGIETVTADMTVIASLPGTVVVDNESDGDEVYCQLDGDWYTSALNGLSGTSTVYAPTGDAAVSWLAFPEAGWYDVGYRQVDHNQPAAPFAAFVYHADGMTEVPYGGSQLEKGWVSLGAFRSDGCSPLVLMATRDGSSRGYLRADAVRFIRLPGTLVDNGQDGYDETGTWDTSWLKDIGVTRNNTRYTRSPAATVSWEDPGLTGEARVLLYRLRHAQNDPEWSAAVMSTGLDEYLITARGGDNGWVDLGRHLFTGGGTVGLAHGSGVLRADAVRFALDTVVRTGDIGYREEGGGWQAGAMSGSDGLSVRSSTAPKAKATWRASLAPGRYRVSWYHVPVAGTSRSTRVEVTVTGMEAGLTPTSIVSDQRSGPAGWTVLGDFDFTSGVGQVQMQRRVPTIKPMRVDAVRFEPLGDSGPVAVVPDGGSG